MVPSTTRIAAEKRIRSVVCAPFSTGMITEGNIGSINILLRSRGVSHTHSAPLAIYLAQDDRVPPSAYSIKSWASSRIGLWKLL